MRRVGTALLALGVVVGVGTGIGILYGRPLPGVESWLANVAVAKLSFIAALGLIGAGAFLRRAGERADVRGRATSRPAGGSEPRHNVGSSAGQGVAALGEGEVPAAPLPASDRVPAEHGQASPRSPSET